MKQLYICLFLVVSLFSCKKDDPIDQAQVDEDLIVKYISHHKLTAKSTGTGLYYVVKKQGTGVNPTRSSSVTVAYKGYLTDGSVFDQSAAVGITFSLSQVIEGWTEGIPLYKEGGSGILLIPSALGYGDQKSGSIPANSVLIFDISLIDVQ